MTTGNIHRMNFGRHESILKNGYFRILIVSLLTFMWIITIDPNQLFAASSTTKSGECGHNLTWTLDGDTLTIEGSGDMYDFVEYPDSWSHRPWYDFRSKITKVLISNQVTRIGEYAFRDTNISEITLPSNLQIIGSHAFEECKNLTKITIPDSVELIENNAFNQCVKLKKIKLPSEKVSSCVVQKKAFSDCRIESLTIPRQIKEIGDYAFAGNEFKKLDISNITNDLGRYVFKNSWGLSKVTIPEQIEKIPEGFFSDCANLREVKIRDGVIKIGSFGFGNCKRLNNIVIPSSVEEIAFKAFNNCPLLKTVHFGGTEEAWEAFKINPLPSNCTVYYGKETDIESVESAQYRQDVSKVRQMLTNGTTIVSIDSTIQSKFTNKGNKELEYSLNLWAGGIVAASNLYREEKNGLLEKFAKKAGFNESTLINKALNKMGIKQNVLTKTKNTYAETDVWMLDKKNEKLRIHVQMDMGVYAFDTKSPYAGFGKLTFQIYDEDGNKVGSEGTGAVAYSDMKQFTDGLKTVAVDNIRKVYNSVWGNSADEVAESLICEPIKQVMKTWNISFSGSIFKTSEYLAQQAAKKIAFALPEKPKVKRKDNKTMTVSWEKVNAAKGYEVSLSKKENDIKIIETTTSLSVNLSVKKKAVGTYYVTVRPYKMIHKKKVYGEWSKVTKIK